MLAAATSVCLALPAGDDARLLPEGNGKDLVIRICLECHGTGHFRQFRLDQEGWSEQITDMVERGAKGTEAEMTAVAGYLEKNFGKDSKVNVNTAPLVEMKTLLGFSVAEAEAVLAYRKENRFRELPDLRKVPGLDAAKVDAKKDRIAF